MAAALLLLLTVGPGIGGGSQRSDRALVGTITHHSYEPSSSDLDEFALQLNRSADAHGLLVAHAGKNDLPGRSLRYLIRAKAYLVNDRGIDPNRLATVEASPAAVTSIELWIADAPSPDAVRPTETSATNRAWRGLTKVDEYSLDDAYGWDAYVADETLRLVYVASELRRDPSCVVFIVGYGARFDEYESLQEDGSYCRGLLDPPGAGGVIARRERKVLEDHFGIAANRVIAIDGGYRQSREIELWLSPSSRLKPKPTPHRYVGRLRNPCRQELIREP